MYDYAYDAQTGGIVLSDRMTQLSNEPRPVYAPEMRLLGMDRHWIFAAQDDAPYLWAEANNYLYHGVKVAKIKGGSLVEAPVLELVMSEAGEDGRPVPVVPVGTVLEQVDIPAMLDKNRQLLAILEQITVKRIYDYYIKHKESLDCFHVAFSGGKDSMVLLELVKKALPHNAFTVLFGDTGMEFPDTYRAVDKVESRCKEEGIGFYRAQSHLDPMDSWHLFGPPSNVLRWCCTVHKAAPQTLKMRELLGKGDYVGADFVGVRAQESLRRSTYEFENYGKKQRGQYSLNPILDWSSAEVWLYIYANGLVVNDAYKKGNSRAGCLLCPMGGGKADYFRRAAYGEDIERYTDAIRDTIEDASIDTYITNGGWVGRRNGRDIRGNVSNYTEKVKADKLVITVAHPLTSWSEWMKTVADVPPSLCVECQGESLVACMPAELDKTPVARQVKQVFHKVAYCKACRVCEANCPHGCISFTRDGLRVADSCVKCGQCRAVEDGCLLYHSLQLPKNGGRVMKKSLNSFADHAPKPEWVQEFYEAGDDFFENNTLGPNQLSVFKRFLNDAGLAEKNKTTDFMRLTKDLGWDSETTWGLILVNLAYSNPQVRWYVDNMPIGERFPRAYLEEKLQGEGLSAKDAKSVAKAFARLCGLPLGTALGFGTVEMKGRVLDALVRGKSSVHDDRVVLYALYRFAEACDGYYQFTLSRLLDETVVSEGICLSRLFGCLPDELERTVRGLSASRPDFIYATFTHGSEKVQLREDKTALDVLALFSE